MWGALGWVSGLRVGSRREAWRDGTWGMDRTASFFHCDCPTVTDEGEWLIGDGLVLVLKKRLADWMNAKLANFCRPVVGPSSGLSLTCSCSRLHAAGQEHQPYFGHRPPQQSLASKTWHREMERATGQGT